LPSSNSVAVGAEGPGELSSSPALHSDLGALGAEVSTAVSPGAAISAGIPADAAGPAAMMPARSAAAAGSFGDRVGRPPMNGRWWASLR
jgi:hypothetical protein